MTDRQVLTNVRDLSSLELMEAHSKAQEEIIAQLRADISQAYDLRDKAEGRYCTALGEIEKLDERLETQKGVIANHVEAERILNAEIARLQGEYNAYRADGEPELRAANAEIMRLLCREQQLMDFVRSFISGGVNQDFKPWASELYQKLYSSHEPKVGAPFPYPTDRDGWICSGCHGWNGPKTRVCLHSHVPLDPQGASREGSGGARSELHSPAVVSSRLPDGDGTLPPRLPPAANISEPFEQRVATSGTTVTGEDSVRKTAESSRPRGLLAQQMEPDISPLTHQEIFHAVNSWAAEIVRLTAAVPVQCTQGASRDTSPLSIAGTGCGNPVMTSAQSYAPCKQPEGHIGECDPPPQRT
jgi:hypothetical protein